MGNKVITEFGSRNAELEARKELVEINGVISRLDTNEDFQTLLKYILEIQVLQWKTQLAFTEPERRMEIMEEFMWRASLEKTLDSLRDIDTVRLDAEIEELSK